MQTPGERTSSEWFHEAARCYVEGHQGCAWCGGAYRVFYQADGRKQHYYCQGCDFQVTYDEQTRTYTVVPGVDSQKGSSKDRQDTMYAG